LIYILLSAPPSINKYLRISCFKLAIDANASCYFEEILKYLFIDGGAESNM
jgi:hypothetical protein